MSMQGRWVVGIVGKSKFGLSWPLFGGDGFAGTGAIRFRFGGGYSGAGRTATGYSVPGFRPCTCSTGSEGSPGVSVFSCETCGQIRGSISCAGVSARLSPTPRVGPVQLAPPPVCRSRSWK